MILLFPSLIHFKTKADRLNFKPRCHMFYGQRVMDVSCRGIELEFYLAELM